MLDKKQIKRKILIIKTGYCEFLDKGKNSRKVSLGDVLSTTSLLHIYKKDYVTWVTDLEALPLLESNPFINRLLIYDFTTALQLKSEEFDMVINLEKVPGICALSDNIRARRKRYGFTFNSQTGEAEAYDKAFDVLAVSSNSKIKRENERTLQELLFGVVGEKWKGEEYILGYKPKTTEIYDVGLNIFVGEKWPTKAWSKERWNKLEEKLIKDNFKVSRQDKQPKEVLTNLNFYIDWINSHKTIVSNDSLGLHLAIALKKNVVGLFGSTSHKEVYFYGRGKAILPKDIPECMPCYSAKCLNDKLCINSITSEEVYTQLKEVMKRPI